MNSYVDRLLELLAELRAAGRTEDAEALEWAQDQIPDFRSQRVAEEELRSTAKLHGYDPEPIVQLCRSLAAESNGCYTNWLWQARGRLDDAGSRGFAPDDAAELVTVQLRLSCRPSLWDRSSGRPPPADVEVETVCTLCPVPAGRRPHGATARRRAGKWSVRCRAGAGTSALSQAIIANLERLADQA